MAGNNSKDSRLDKLIRLAERNEKLWAHNEKRWDRNDHLWKKLAAYIRRSEADRKAILKRMAERDKRMAERDKKVDERMEKNQQEIIHLCSEFRRWIKEQ